MSQETTERKKKSRRNDDNYKQQMTRSTEFTSYIIVNNDLNMSKGKIASQSAHAILDVYRFLITNSIDKKGWENNGEKIVVLKASFIEIKQILEQYSEYIPMKNKLNVFPVYDAGRTEVESGSLTVIATTPITEDVKPEILKSLKLV